ncbi:glycosyltransferase [Subtercola lobariae]|uniref:D-inositol 3-phosphate glycosyltransferase n=1 Tax=Subtercola lobariae TaxID=1588641 RepID=A0A917BIX5_9MICO|nr:glycosyltransferase [Subtercola lobariae]GGF41341.1 glycosyl transferase family 1 [Subtercola lobariae]
MTPTVKPLRIAVIAPLRYAISEPHAGGLESSIWHQVNQLIRRGHHVVLCAVRGSDFMAGSPPEFVMPAAAWGIGDEANDTDYPPGYLDEALLALDAALDYLQAHSAQFDVVHNHSLQGTPLRRAPELGIPMLSTLHTPVLPELVDAHQIISERGSSFVAVSSYTSSEWRGAGIRSTVLPNAVDQTRWLLGGGGDDLVWFGRIVAEKGAHLAIETARLLGRRIVLAGRVGDPAYAAEKVWPLLGRDVVYAGDLRHDELAALVGQSACALVTPTWQEPFGLIIVEALMTGTPVACFDAGGIREVISGLTGTHLAPMGDCIALAAGAQTLIDTTSADPGVRAGIRSLAVARYSLDARITQLEELYRRSAVQFQTDSMTASGEAA